jgi:hypothetical protein
VRAEVLNLLVSSVITKLTCRHIVSCSYSGAHKNGVMTVKATLLLIGYYDLSLKFLSNTFISNPIIFNAHIKGKCGRHDHVP